MEDGNVTRIVLVDDQLLYREGLHGLIDHWSEFSVVGEASNGKEAVELCRRLHPDLVLMDLQMPVMNGTEAASLIHEEFPDIVIVMLTVATNEELVFDALSTGVRGYLLKDTPARQLRLKLHDVLSGDMSLSGVITSMAVDELSRLREEAGVRALSEKTNPSISALAGLSQREIDVLRLVAQGKSNEEISAELYLSLGTVKKQLGVIMQRLYVENRVQLAVWAVKNGLAN